MNRPFAQHGGEKMLYDVRMGPQAVRHREVIYIAYQANADGVEAHPHLITYDLAARTGSDAVQVGCTAHHDHHFAPILWFDRQEHVHVLYNCHGHDGGIHLISAQPRAIHEWVTGPQIWRSISYPRVIPLPDGRLLLYYRAFGHMGYWTYQISDDGGYPWTRLRPRIDFDQAPQSDDDTWAGSYQSVRLAFCCPFLASAVPGKARSPLSGAIASVGSGQRSPGRTIPGMAACCAAGRRRAVGLHGDGRSGRPGAFLWRGHH